MKIILVALPKEMCLQITFVTVSILILLYLYFLNYKPYAMLIASVMLSFTTATELNDSANAAFILGHDWTLDILLGGSVAVVMKLIFKVIDTPEKPYFVNLFSEVKCLFLAFKHDTSMSKTITWNHIAFIKAIRIILIFFIITFINAMLNFQDYTVQALIRSVVVSTQISLSSSYTKSCQRIIGAIIGCCAALITLKVMTLCQFSIHWFWLNELWLCLFLFLALYNTHHKYLYFQAGLLVIILLTGRKEFPVQSLEIALLRVLGNFEGAFISMMIIFASNYFIKKNVNLIR